MRTHLSLLLALALGAGCGQRGDSLPAAPRDRFQFPALMAAVGQGVTEPVLLVDSLDIDGMYADGTLLAAPVDPSLPFLLPGVSVVPNATEVRAVQDAPAVLRGFDEPTATACAKPRETPSPKLFLGAPDRLYRMDLVNGVPTCGEGCEKRLKPRFASDAWPLAVSCPPGPTPDRPGTRRVWVGFLKGKNDNGFVGQLTLDDDVVNPETQELEHHDLDDLVEVNVGKGMPQAFAFDADKNRLYFVTREDQEASFLRWIDPGTGGCKAFPDDDGLQDETRGGCHVDTGVELNQWLRGAEGVDVRLGSQPVACETPVEQDVPCRRAYLAIRVYDADLAALSGNRPLDDIGGQLWVMEIPQGPTRPTPRLLHRFDVGNGVARLQVIPRPSGRDLVAIVAREDAQLWIYDDALGVLGVGVGRDLNGTPLLGHKLMGLAAVDQGGGVARLYASSMTDHWISAVDVDLADPSASCVVHTGGATACAPQDPVHPNQSILRIKGNLP